MKWTCSVGVTGAAMLCLLGLPLANPLAAQEAAVTASCGDPANAGWPFPFAPNDIPWGMTNAEFEATFEALKSCKGYQGNRFWIIISGIRTDGGVVDVELKFADRSKRLYAIDVWGPGSASWAQAWSDRFGVPLTIRRQNQIETESFCTFNQCRSVSRPVTRESNPSLIAGNVRLTYFDAQQVHRFAKSFKRSSLIPKLELRRAD